MTLKFSIITAVKNDLKGLQETFNSLHRQTVKDFEWIVIDAASTDGTQEWLSKLDQNNINLKWISERDKGISDAWNKGINLASGDYVLILNAGDTYDETLIEKFSSCVRDEFITCCHTRLISEYGDYLGLFKAHPKRLWRGMHLPHNWCCVPRKFYIKFGYYKLLPHSMDFEWFHRVFKILGSSKFHVIDEALGSYRLGGHSDINFQAGFFANQSILQKNGMPSFLAWIICNAYIAKHKWMKHSISVRKSHSA